MLRQVVRRSFVSRRLTTPYIIRGYASRPGPSQAQKPVKESGEGSTPTPPTETPPSHDTPTPFDAPPQTAETLPSLDFVAEEKPDAKRTGARSSKDSLSSSERRRRFMARIAIGSIFVGLGTYLWTLTEPWEAEELKKMNMTVNEAPATRWLRMKTRVTDTFNTYQNPVWDKLLPDLQPAPYQKPYTLVLSLDDLLVTSIWDREHGWRTAKRPGVDYFIAYLSQFYEVVIFTTQPYYTGLPITDKLDPYQLFTPYRLFRESTRAVNGQVVKDLSFLNRDLSKVIIIDTHPEHVSLQKENAILPAKWTGDPKDRGLVALIPFLESLAIYKPRDVRPILGAYEGKDIPSEYAKVEASEKKAHIERWSAKGGHNSSDLSLSGLFGGSGSGKTRGPPPTYLELKRAEAQRSYLEDQAQIAKNKDEWDRLMEEDRQKQLEQMPTNLSGMFGAMMGGPPPSKDQLDAQNKA